MLFGHHLAVREEKEEQAGSLSNSPVGLDEPELKGWP